MVPDRELWTFDLRREKHVDNKKIRINNGKKI